jgi:hypothetical protein
VRGANHTSNTTVTTTSATTNTTNNSNNDDARRRRRRRHPPTQADVTEEALDLIDGEIQDAARNIAERKQLAQRCSQAEELEITNDAFYQYVTWPVFSW